MTDRKEPAAALAGGVDLTAEVNASLAAKTALADKLFKHWRTRDEDTGGNAIRLLSYSPKTRDKLNEGDQKNADIFTSQRWAAKQAHEVFSVIRQNPQLVDALKNDDPFHIALVGSSVTGLTFHAVLKTLMDLWAKGASENPRKKFEDLFQIKYVDSHQRPMQRLLQARDRRIIPRFEYEKIFDKIYDNTDETPALYTTAENQADLVEAWNDLKRLDANVRTMIKDNCDALKVIPICGTSSVVMDGKALFMPTALCWQAGGVRDVAKQIETGFYKLVPGHPFDEPDTRDWFQLPKPQPQSTTGGPIFLSVTERSKSIVPNTLIRRFVVNFAGENAVPKRDGGEPGTNSDGQAPQPIMIYDEVLGRMVERQVQVAGPLMVDMVLLATGPGVDISASHTPKETVSAPLGIVANSQDSFWNTPKADLDLVEGRPNTVLILGHSDSAAGAVFTTLLRDPEACSYRLLTDLLSIKNGEVRAWFKRVKAAVDKVPATDASSTTEKWLQALKDDTVLAALYDTQDTDLNVRNGELRQFLRSSVDVAIALRPDDNCKVVNAAGAVPQFMLFSEGAPVGATDATSPEPKMLLEPAALRKKLFDKAWPENQLLLALMTRWLQFYQMPQPSLELDPEKQVIKSVKESSPSGTTALFKHKTEIFKVMRTQNDGSIEECFFKYVFDCRGPTYYSRDGNHFKQPKIAIGG